ncbi:MAG: hypothetical protein CMK09_18105 [Ponticaulis sp.]|nr:hypothetical protein [Ponticaulis sp.]|tara:strand:+ start:11407 stop:11643 length:237 start_codon:yes stop_codon:yes gene_type:complete
MSVHLGLSVLAILLAIGFAVFCSYRAGLPRDDLKPKRLPWTFLMILSGFLAFILLVHLFNVLGFETGPENSIFGRGIR